MRGKKRFWANKTATDEGSGITLAMTRNASMRGAAASVIQIPLATLALAVTLQFNICLTSDDVSH